MKKFFLLILVALLPVVSWADVEINKRTFPDYYFRRWLLNEDVGYDGLLTDAEIASVTEMYLFEDTDPIMIYRCGPVASLEGIEYFTSLTKLRCGGLSLTELDLTKNTKLKWLLLHENSYLTKVDVSGTEVQRIECADNWRLNEFKASGCTGLDYMECVENKLTELDVTGCTALSKLIIWGNIIRGAGMENLVESLPNTSSGVMIVQRNEGSYQDQNMITTLQVAAAKAKGWSVRRYYNGKEEEYAGIEPTEVVTFTEGQMATIILPKAPKAEWGRYYRLDRCEDGRIIFKEELQPQSHIPYIIVPSRDFIIDLNSLDLAGLGNDIVSIEDVSFIGSYISEDFGEREGFYIDIIDTTPDCRAEAGVTYTIGALRAYLQVHWDDPISQDGTRSPRQKMEVVLLDDGDGIGRPSTDPSLYGGEIYNLAGQRVTLHRGGDGRGLQRGIYIENGRKVVR